MPRVAVVDIGTNSTRLLIADVGDDGLQELDRRSIVTRLGEGLEASGELGQEPRARVFRALEEYAQAIDEHDVEVRTAVLTSAVRDAANGAAFTTEVRERFGLDAQTISGDEEARLTFLGATASRDPQDRDTLMVVDIGGGSTELVVGQASEVEFHVSTQVGVVRHSERHLHHDPPQDDELQALSDDARETIDQALPGQFRERVRQVVAVAGTATMTAAMDLELEPYDSARVEGHRLTVGTLRAQLEQLASLPLDQRREVKGLHPDRAATIVAGVAILLQVLDAVGAGEVQVSDRDILWGRALDEVVREDDGGSPARPM
jgi:exopolyphosphatase / guanosine-5'-triphosphate,3'-diphosphate pyrophosphatase